MCGNRSQQKHQTDQRDKETSVPSASLPTTDPYQEQRQSVMIRRARGRPKMLKFQQWHELAGNTRARAAVLHLADLNDAGLLSATLNVAPCPWSTAPSCVVMSLPLQQHEQWRWPLCRRAHHRRPDRRTVDPAGASSSRARSTYSGSYCVEHHHLPRMADQLNHMPVASSASCDVSCSSILVACRHLGRFEDVQE